MTLTSEERQIRAAARKAEEKRIEEEALQLKIQAYVETLSDKLMELIAFAQEEGVPFSLRKTTHEAEDSPKSNHSSFWTLSIQSRFQEYHVTSMTPSDRDSLNDSIYYMDRAFSFLEHIRDSRLQEEAREARRRQLLAGLTKEDKELLGLT